MRVPDNQRLGSFGDSMSSGQGRHQRAVPSRGCAPVVSHHHRLRGHPSSDPAHNVSHDTRMPRLRLRADLRDQLVEQTALRPAEYQVRRHFFTASHLTMRTLSSRHPHPGMRPNADSDVDASVKGLTHRQVGSIRKYSSFVGLMCHSEFHTFV
jgi:hypothetical protein